jgi:hypothetical protein
MNAELAIVDLRESDAFRIAIELFAPRQSHANSTHDTP